MKTKGPRILIVDDDLLICKFLRIGLTSRDYVVKDVGTGQEALDKITSFSPDLVILDITLPDIDGMDVLHIIREWSKVPIIILSSTEHEQAKITALDSGANDYVTKPFGMGELLARIRTGLRHTMAFGEEHVLRFDDLSIDLAHRTVTLIDEEIKLTPIEYELVKNLATNAGKVLTHKFLLHNLRGGTFENNNQYLRVYIGNLRQKIERDPSRPRHIITEPGVGYRFL
jgi:two-component system, OmpR family, KDP operon response regulator KdpE